MNVIKAVIVDFGDDRIKALYLDGKLQMQGDYYHDKIDETIVGFIDGAMWCGRKFDIEKFVLPWENGQEEIYTAPKFWPDNNFSNKVIKNG